MIQLKTDLFTLGELQLRREGKRPSDRLTVKAINRAIKIRKWLDLSIRNKKVALARR